MREALGSFIDIDLKPPLQVLDRTSMQLAASCPFKAAAYHARKLNIGEAARVGQEVHDAFGRVTRAYVETNGDYYAGQLKQMLVDELHASRPDLQPLVINAAVASAWSWACYLKDLNPSNILAFDGGEDIGKGGQLACDFNELGVKATGELDFLHAGPSPKLLHYIDYKSGHGQHTAASVANDFQFQMYSLLVLTNWDTIDAVEVSVWNTRTNRLTYPVVFDRTRDLPRINARVRMAIQHHLTSVLPYDIDDPDNQPPTWPTSEKCGQCDAACICPAAGQPIADVARDPVGALRQLVVIDGKRDSLAKALTAHTDKHGDLVDGEIRYGRNKPRTERKAPASIYTLSKENESNGSDGN
jgi:hypothetical protein